MQYISSDTNVWVDFAVIERLEFPFRLPYTYIMDYDAVHDELLYPKGIREKLLDLGLEVTELTEEEFWLAEAYMVKYSKPSTFDCIALAIAKTRGIMLLSGDGPLRKAAECEGVKVIGTIGIMDRLAEEKLISAGEYRECLERLLKENGGKVRLPGNEILKRLGR